MKSDNYVVATIKPWNIKEAQIFTSSNPEIKIKLIDNIKRLSYSKLKNIKPKYVFFPHWSWIIPQKIYENFECIVFHMTDLPYGRGGSPLQNLIESGIKETKISAIRVVKGIDAGPVYLKKRLGLTGSAEEIFKRASKIIFEDIIPYIIKKNPTPVAQKGRVVRFKRRIPGQSNISRLKTTGEVYDYIRMLDAEGYPKAFIETGNLKFEFHNAKYRKNYVIAEVKIEVKK